MTYILQPPNAVKHDTFSHL